jgi:NADPH-dependent 2,4-dienoyl-CoA reductase/sulfur reductase-like enzyme
VTGADAHELLTVGGGPAALSAARAYREAGGSGSVAMVTDERRMPYQRPALSKELLRGETTEGQIPLESDRWPAEHGTALIGGRAVCIDLVQHTLLLSGGREIEYGSCLLATGAEPVRLPIPGADDPAVRTLRSLEDNRELRARLEHAPSVVVIGSGFIGCEIAASLSMLGQRVSLVAQEPAPNVGRLGEQAAAEIQRWLEALGVRPRAELAALAGLDLENGGIPADAQMRAQVPGLLAAGDVCLAHNAAAGRRVHIEHWGDALAQGEVAPPPIGPPEASNRSWRSRTLRSPRVCITAMSGSSGPGTSMCGPQPGPTVEPLAVSRSTWRSLGGWRPAASGPPSSIPPPCSRARRNRPSPW